MFKYPPWILPFFIPFGLMSLGLAKLCWGLVEVLSLVAVVQWVRVRLQCREAIWVGVLIFFWGLWAVHALDGQIALTLLAVALWAWVPDGFEKSWIRSFILVFTLSTKIFTLFPLLQNRPSKRLLSKVPGVLGVLLLFSLPALMTEHPGNPISRLSSWTEHSNNPFSLFSSWRDAATSGGTLLSTAQIRGRYNPSLTSFILRLLQIPANQPWVDVTLACILGLVLGLVWKFASQNISRSEAWVGWLALAPVIHPLPWWHLFVFSFPLAVVSLDRSWRELSPNHTPLGECLGRKRALTTTGIALIGIALICISTEKFLGPLGLFLEMACAKSWGVLLCAGALTLCRNSSDRSSELRRTIIGQNLMTTK